MFDIIRSIKKITGLQKRSHEQVVDTQQSDSHVQTMESRVDKFSGFINHFISFIVVEYRIIKEKMQDLSKTNYDLGIKHLENGNLKEAIFRFKITKRFWPHNYEAYYELVYCLILENEFDEAQKVIDDLLKKCPSYKEKIDQLFLPPEQELELPEDLQVSQIEVNQNEDLQAPEDLAKSLPNINSNNQNLNIPN
jgi:tetratricopeptide (TPR) repeat protein